MKVVKGFLLITLLCWIFIAVLVFALAILFKYGGPAFLLFAVVVSCIVGIVANYIWEKRDEDEGPLK